MIISVKQLHNVHVHCAAQHLKAGDFGYNNCLAYLERLVAE